MSNITAGDQSHGRVTPHWSRRLAALCAVAMLASLGALVPGPAYAAAGFTVSGTRILDANGTNFIARGINHAHTFYPTQTSSFANIKAAGANAVRVVLSGGRWGGANSASDVANVISLCKTNKLVCVLDYQDTTGFGEASGAATMAQAVSYWTGMTSVLQGQEAYVIINIANEPYGNTNYTLWTSETSAAIHSLRNAGLTNQLWVDAPNWGQDWTFTMRDNAPTVAAADTLKNTVFSVHMYGVFDTAPKITAYIDSFASKNLPLVVGEFGDAHADGNPDEATIMSYTTQRGTGYFGWSWSGNGGGVEYLDMVYSFNPASRSPWGNRFITGANGLSTTSTEASIYGSSTDTQAPTVPASLRSTGVTSSTVALAWNASTDNVGVTGYKVYRGSAQVGTATSTTFTDTGLAANTAYTYTVRARDAAGNQSAASNSVTATTAAPTNLAVGKAATASSVDTSSSGLVASAAVDGNMGTRWASAYSDPQWIRIDLGSTSTINRVLLNWEVAYGRGYQIQTSNDGTTWTNIFSTTTGDGGTDDLAVSGSGRYIRMNGTARGTSWGYSLWEFQVFGS